MEELESEKIPMDLLLMPTMTYLSMKKDIIIIQV